jgi:CheY-like chemotaxis protein
MQTELILIIEDDQHLSRFEATIIFSLGLLPVRCFNGRDGIEALSIITPNAAFIDFNMPYATGDEVVKYIRKNERLKDILVVLYSGTPEQSLNHELYDLIIDKSNFEKIIEVIKWIKAEKEIFN